MNNKHRKTLEAIFKTPAPKNIIFSDVVSLIKNIGAEFIEDKRGSRVGFILNGVKITIHAPHPGKELKQYAVRDIKEFLKKAGVKK